MESADVDDATLEAQIRSFGLAARREIARVSLIDEIANDLEGQVQEESALREELCEGLLQRQADHTIKTAIGEGILPPSGEVDHRLSATAEIDAYSGDHASDLEEDVVLGLLLEPKLTEEEQRLADKCASADHPVERMRKARTPSKVYHPLDGDSYFAEYLAMWKGAVASAIDAFNTRDALSTSPLGGTNAEMSLVRIVDETIVDDGTVCQDRRVAFVNWKRGHAGTIGQEVSDDKSGYVIFPIALHYPFKPLAGVEILCPAIGCRVKKASADSGRALFTAFSLRLRDMYACLDGFDTFALCKACGQAHVREDMPSSSSSSSSGQAPPAPPAEASLVVTCPVCLIPYHRACAQRFLNRCKADQLLPHAAACSSATVPPEFSSSKYCCPPCSHILSQTM
jgi:hypothetical protein